MLESAPAALALDNVETPWEADTLSVEEFLAEIAGVPGLALIASLRGATRPGGLRWRQAIEPQRLPIPEARKVFLAIAGAKFASSPDLDSLLDSLDRIPLAINLVAFASQDEADLNRVWTRWQQERTALLKKGGADHRLLGVEVSYEISINGPGMTSEALRLLALLGCLPDGIAHKDLDTVCPAFGGSAASVLRKTGLAFDMADRLRVLAPLRVFVQKRHPPQREDLSRAMAHYLGLAISHGEKLGQGDGVEAIARLTPEISNLDAMILRGLDEPDPDSAIVAALGLGSFVRFAGFGGTSALEKAATLAEKKNSNQGLAADCIYALGEIALRRADYNFAQQRFEKALQLFKRVGDVEGEANCIHRLGDASLERCEHDTASRRYQQALTLFKRLGDVLGEANCIQCLGDVAVARSEHDTARQRYEQALPLFERAGDIRAQASCIQRLGNVCLGRSEHDAARRWYEQALPLLERVGDIRSQADCIQHLGDVALRLSDRDSARQRYGEALSLYQEISEPYLIGWARRRLARLARDDEERRGHVKAARTAWQSIGRGDLVRDLVDEFGQT
ncbi:MAG: tetratricopeptide repeat protein, partial [Verrucomicrobia bacterium]|nr:tetratricopeptide repeat protein [Verrucomicrobiota bacterium]